LLRSGKAIPLTDWAAAGIATDYLLEEHAPEDPDVSSDEHEESQAEAQVRLASVELMAVLLFLARQSDEARRALSDYQPPGDEPGPAKKHARFVRHFERFLDEGSGPPPRHWPTACRPRRAKLRSPY
jgi:hypothetical protein